VGGKRIATIRSFAKINWFLRIESERDDGYHNIDSILQLIDVYDEIEIYRSDSHDRIQCNIDIPTGPGSMLAVLLTTVRDLYPPLRNMGFSLRIRKYIPPASGLGGGSSNVAALLRFFSRITGVNVSREALLEASASIGSDVPFFASEIPFARIKGKGEHVFALEHAPHVYLVLAFPGFGIPTAWAFSAWDTRSAGKPKTEDLATNAPEKYVKNIQSLIHDSFMANDFEDIVFSTYPRLVEVREILIRQGCSRVFLSGSGSTLVGCVRGKDSALRVSARLKDQGIESRVAQTLTHVPLYIQKGNSEGRKSGCPTQ